jgi:serine/threonine-protein phosphatase 2B regulatory subunit
VLFGVLPFPALVFICWGLSTQASEAAVIKKAKTIMKQADKDGDNEINFEEFQVISKKFPNILFPDFKGK